MFVFLPKDVSRELKGYLRVDTLRCVKVYSASREPGSAIISRLVPLTGYITSSQWDTAALAGATIAQLTRLPSATIKAEPFPPPHPPPAAITPFWFNTRAAA